ncbi:glycosyl hydrolase family 61-domain-containing protein [Ephemerocybe angulata]|uniref:AA9 family lytic polysaccharide monooxygenase n=1 Tax=Ephemerocybe angulata TaxID=980116 RepID=A0A8H6I8T3_9AGAR|nr:glycosyl hydrolase family 61-domain-containing protein [Tulosesus angulatus]
MVGLVKSSVSNLLWIVSFLGSHLDTALGHWVYEGVTSANTTTTSATRIPVNWAPIFESTDPNMLCNNNTGPAKETLSVSAGSAVVFRMAEGNYVYHPGPAAVYLGMVPEGESAKTWDGSGARWFKIKEWSTGEPSEELYPDWNGYQFAWPWQTMGSVTLHATIPAEVPSGEYLLRSESTSFAVYRGAPQWWVSCAQIQVFNGGEGTPPMVEIPGHIQADDPNLQVDTYSAPLEFRVPGPDVWPA